MKTLDMMVYTVKDISTEEYAKEILGIFSEFDLLPDKIGLYEPVREPFHIERAYEIWKHRGGGGNFFRGELVGKKINPKINYSFVWHKGKNARINYISIMFHGHKALTKLDDIDRLFKKLVVSVSGVYGYISDYDIESRQFIPGLLTTRLPGVFWCNYYDNDYLKFLGEENLYNIDWYKTEKIKKGCFFYLVDQPNSIILKTADYEKSIRDRIGIDFFGDSTLYKNNIDLKQNTLAPSFDLKELSE